MSQSAEATLGQSTPSLGSSGSAHDVTCGQCQRHNVSGSKFCAGCGTCLWEPCLACGMECSSAEDFCSGCGANLKELVAKQIDAAQQTLLVAKDHVSRREFSDAVRKLKAVQLADDPRLASMSQTIQAQIVAIQERADRESRDLHAGLARIQELIDNHAYGDAVRLLEKLPPAYRTADTEKLLSTAKAKETELANLKSEIREAIDRKQLLELAPKIQRVLTLQPNSENMLRLSEQVRDRLLLAANKRLAAFDYKQARELLSRVPECARDDKTNQMSSRIAEFTWLVGAIQSAPVVDEPLLEIAKRFSKKAPGDKKNVARCTKLFRLDPNEGNSTSKRFPFPTWATPPRRTHVGCAVDWLGGSEQLRFADETAQKLWLNEPGRYFVAAGLALQGIGAAEVRTNLNREERQGLLGGFALGRRKEPVKRAWGIDIGESSVKVLRLVCGEDQDTPVVDRCDHFPHQVTLSRPDAESNRHRLIVESLNAFLSKYPVDKSDRICAGFPGHRVLGRTLRLPEAAPKKFAEMIRFEASQQIPIPLEELAWSYESFPESADKADTSIANTLLVAAKQRDVQELKLIFEEAQIELHALQSDAVALFNYARFEQLHELAASENSQPPSIGLLDVGAAATNVVILTGDRPWIRSFRRGGDHFTGAAAGRLNLTKDQAEQVKIEPTRVRRLSELYDAYDPIFASLMDEVLRSLESFRKETGREVSNLFGVGGGFRLHGLLKHLRYGS